jgi:hypothetical protein
MGIVADEKNYVQEEKNHENYNYISLKYYHDIMSLRIIIKSSRGIKCQWEVSPLV